MLGLLLSHYNQFFVGLIGAGASAIVILRGNDKHSWQGHLSRLRAVNVIAIAMFVLSSMKIVDEYNGHVDKASFSKIKIIELCIPFLGLFMSSIYMIGFLGITVVSALMEDVPPINQEADKSPCDTSCLSQRSPEITVVGGGCAGCSVALAMARKGRKVVLIERDLSYQDRIVGELLQPGGIRALERMGLSDCAKEGIDSVMVHGYVVIDPLAKSPSGAPEPPRYQILKYPNSDPKNYIEFYGIPSDSDEITPETMKPLGRSFHHGKFVQRLREKALNNPLIQVIEGNVSRLIEEDGRIIGVEYRVKEGEETHLKTSYTPMTFVADGIWSSHRKSMTDSPLTTASSFVGVVVDHPSMASPVPHPLHGHVILADPSPCLIYQISSTETRVLVDVLGPLPSSSTGELQTYLIDKVAPQMPESFRESFVKAVHEKELKSMPNRFMPARAPLKKGAFLIGDALNMRHPLTGGGMTVAIRDAETIANLMGNAGNNLSDLDLQRAKYEEFLRIRKNYASTINVLANALHAVFSAPPGNPTRQSLRQACFDYLSLGGPYAAGPIGLLSGLTPKPEILATHFFMVALFGVKKAMSEGLSLINLKKTHDLMRIACSIILPLLKQEQTTVLSWYPVRTLATLLFPPVSLLED